LNEKKNKNYDGTMTDSAIVDSDYAKERNKKDGESMMKNNLAALNDKLFEQLDRLTEADAGSKMLDKEIRRSKAVSSIAKNIIDNASVVLDAHRTIQGNGKLPKMIAGAE
jgi:hypothetical protein